MTSDTVRIASLERRLEELRRQQDEINMALRERIELLERLTMQADNAHDERITSVEQRLHLGF